MSYKLTNQLEWWENLPWLVSLARRPILEDVVDELPVIARLTLFTSVEPVSDCFRGFGMRFVRFNFFGLIYFSDNDNVVDEIQRNAEKGFKFFEESV